MQTRWIILAFFVVAVIATNAYVANRTYKRNAKGLNTSNEAITIQPKRSRFFVSWFALCLINLLPVFLVLWFLPIDKVVFYFSLSSFPVAWAISVFPVYPYYTLTINDAKLNGPTLWGWRWRRTEIDISEIDREKVLQRNVGRMLGMTVFKSVNGTKILSLGLDDSQIRKILDNSIEVK